jgi:cytidylate kinase
MTALAMTNRPFVLGLAGPPGAGKTTVASQLQRGHPGTRVISFDKYQSLTRLSQAQIRDWFENGADINVVDHSAIIADLRREATREHSRTRRPLLLFETPFGRFHRETGAFIDFLVWIDTPLDLALSRVVLSRNKNAQRENSPQTIGDFIAWQIQYMTFYPTLRIMYLAQRQKVAPEADLSVDGSRPPEELTAIIDMSLASFGVA